MSISKAAKNRIAITVMAVLTLFLIVSFVGGAYLLKVGVGAPSEENRSYQGSLERMAKDYPGIMPWYDSLMACNAMGELTMLNRDSVQLHSVYIPARDTTRATALIVHGYSDTPMDMLQIAYLYHHDLGYNVFLPDLFAHGKSQGDHVQMGFRDRLDVLEWIPIADSLFGGGTVMVVHGISMGGATTMGVAGEDTPPMVKCFVEDCGFTSVWDEFRHKLKEMYGLPPFPLLYTADILCQWKYGWSFHEASPVEAVRRAKLPMLFIHGDADRYVPSWMHRPLYEACTSPKGIFVAKGSKHGKAYRDHPGEYTQVVRDFLAPYINTEK
ncbi:MAG: hypothetical protein CSA97_05180 [Bacteroidetes bacterium]|nr:MAG: hypothetical protein CSA97_05180 [Bacteroidota bacterium]